MAKALSIINPNSDRSGTGQATAKTSFGGVSVQSNATFDSGTVEAIAEGGSGPTFLPNGDVGAISVALPDKAYATTLIDGASNVADALLGPGDIIFGTASLTSLGGTVSSTFDFRYQGDLLLGVINGGGEITVNGAVFSGFGDDTVIDLGSNFGPNIDLTIFGGGTFAFGGAVPEVSTWAMVLLGFAGLGYAGYRRAREPRAA
ncbi:MAG TPA: hypothetical protein VGG77_16895 [Roseiarcus sp.]